MTEYNIRLNPNCASAVHTGLKFKSGDKGITFKIAVDELDTTGTTAKIVFLRANGTSVESDISGTDGVYTYKTLGNEFAVPGKTVADVKIYASGNRESTASFLFDVCGDTMDGLGAGAGGYSDRLEQLVKEAEEAKKEAENVSGELENLLIVYQNKFGEVGVLNPSGTYNSSTTYEAFDLVYYSGASWLCLQRCTGITPAEGTYWQLFASADGGNAAKLGGKGASEYVQKTGDSTIDGNIELKSTGAVGRKVVLENKNRRVTLEIDASGACYLWDATNNKAIGSFHLDGDYRFNGIATECLPKTGGTAGRTTFETAGDAPVYVSRSDASGALVRFEGKGEILGFLGFVGEDTPVFVTKGVVNKKLIHEGNVGSYALPISGGRVSYLEVALADNGFGAFAKNNTDTLDNGTMMTDWTKDGAKARLVVKANANKAYFADNADTLKELLHSGNVGSYALPIKGGNVGDGTQHTPFGLIGGTEFTLIQYKDNKNVSRGAIGFRGTNNPVVLDAAAQNAYSIHHDGNSAKVVQATSAPSDTTAVWVDTANKKTKAYIDGAWTALT